MKEYLSDLYARLGGQMKLGLERTHELMARLDHPENAFQSIHVAGTNGKGSVVAVCEAILRHAGYITGRFTSPHLVHFNERICINGSPVPEESIESKLSIWQPWLEEHEISFFEITTGLAFSLFRDYHVNAAIIETGLGGRLDATNVLKPQVTVITSIAHDHTNILGETLRAIAGEKAGIIKQNTPLVTCSQDPTVLEVLQYHANNKHAPFYKINPFDYFSDFRLKPEGMFLKMKRYNSWIKTPLMGIHQLENFALAIKACDLFTQGNLPKSAVIEGLISVEWRGRFELLRENPFVFYDVAHNPSGVERLKELVLTLFPHKPLTLVIGMLGDKDIHNIVDILLPFAAHCFLSPVNSHRSVTKEALEALSASRSKTEVTSSLDEALNKALETTPSQGILLIYGSHYIAPEVYHTFQPNKYNQSPKIPLDPTV